MISHQTYGPIFLTAAGLLFLTYGVKIHGTETCRGDELRTVAPAATITSADVAPFYHGTFQWDGSDELQTASLDVESVSETNRRGRSLIVATGRGTYEHFRDAHFSFRIEFDKQSGEFVMTESDPSVESGFITEGRHRGRVVGTPRNLEARWLDHHGGQGTLQLTATAVSLRPSEPSAPAHPASPR